MTTIWAYLAAHQTIVALVAYYTISAAIGSLPMPDNTSSKFYRWFFQFSNTISANIARAWASKLPPPDKPIAPTGN